MDDRDNQNLNWFQSCQLKEKYTLSEFFIIVVIIFIILILFNTDTMLVQIKILIKKIALNFNFIN